MNAVPHGHPGPDLVQTLVDALTLLECVKDRTQRGEFVETVAYRLGVELTYPDSTPRVAMTHLVRKVIHRPGGPEALVYAVRTVSGPDEAERIAAEAGIRTGTGRPGPWLAPVFAEDIVRQARRLLVEAKDIDPGRLAALLGDELPGDLPDHGTPAELLDHALDMTARPDGLPAAVVLVEAAAALSAEQGTALRRWADRWAEAEGPAAPAGDARAAVAGAQEALADCRRRLERPAAPDPTVPRCLVVMVEPARDGSPDVFVRHWLNKVPGYWRPEQGVMETVTLNTLAGAVERAVERGEALWAETPKGHAGQPEPGGRAGKAEGGGGAGPRRVPAPLRPAEPRHGPPATPGSCAAGRPAGTMEAKAPEARVVRSGQPRIMGNVPPKNPNFTGRESLLAAVERQLTEDETTAVLPHALHGLGGVGTSQIAVEYVYRHSGEYIVIWWIPAEQESLILAALAELAAGLGLEVGPQANTAVPAVREALRTGKPLDNWLLVFDNAEDIESVRSYFPNGGPGKIVVTSRNREWERVATPLSVDVFDREESIALLQRRARGLSTHDAGRLAEALGDLPLAVEQAGAWHAATGMPVDEYLRLLDERRPGILELAPSPDYPLPVAAVWDISRHLPGLLHGAYAFVGVAGFWRDRIGDRAADPLGLAPFRFALRRLQTRTVLRTLATRAALTGPGRRLVAGLPRTVDGWLREPVDGRAVARARAAAAGHRVEWRLRNLRCADEERAGLGAALRTGAPPPPLGQPLLVPASERTHWQDVRGALYLRPDSALDVTVADIGPRAASVAAPDAASVTVARGVRPRATPPVRADVLLIRGESAAAREAYRERWAEAPGDPHPLAGWLLAHTALHPGHRRLLARPERFAAAAAAEGPEVWEHAAHRLAAAPPPV